MAFIGHAVTEDGEDIYFDDFVHEDYRERIDLACNQVAVLGEEFINALDTNDPTTINNAVGRLRYAVAWWAQLSEEGVMASPYYPDPNEDDDDDWEEDWEEDDDDDDSEYEEPWASQEEQTDEPQGSAITMFLPMLNENNLPNGPSVA